MMRVHLSLLPVILISIVAVGNIGGCGNLGFPCSYNFNTLTNGLSPETQDSEWSCKNGGIEVFTIAFFGGGVGTRSDAGDFTWDQTNCRTIEFETESQESGTLDKVKGSLLTVGQVPTGTLTFDQSSEDLGNISVVCDYVLLD
jgi:hypothetical protein